MNKEQAYDTKLHPLMDQVVAICREHGIAMVASFAIPTEEEESLRCTTHLPDGDGNFDDRCRRAYLAVRGQDHEHSLAMITIEHADGSKSMTAVAG